MSYEMQIKDFKSRNTEAMQYLLSKNGGLSPTISVLVKEKDDKINIVVVPVPNELLQNLQGKDLLAQSLPKLFELLVKENKQPICFSFSSEAWLRKTPEGTKEIPDNWQDLPKIECLISTYESADESDMRVYEIIREGKMANDEGDLIDAIVLRPYLDEKDEPMTNMKGRFSGIFQEFCKMKQNES